MTRLCSPTGASSRRVRGSPLGALPRGAERYDAPLLVELWRRGRDAAEAPRTAAQAAEALA